MATSITFNGLIVDIGKTPILKINNGVQFQYNGKSSETLHPYANELNISTLGTSRIWTTSIVIVAKRVENAALDYANMFLNRTGVECGTLNVLETTWNDLGAIYNGMDSEVRAEFDGVLGVEGGSALEEMVLRYTYIQNKYKYVGFMNLGVEEVNQPTQQIVSMNTFTSLIVFGSLILIASLIFYSMMKNRKEYFG